MPWRIAALVSVLGGCLAVPAPGGGDGGPGRDAGSGDASVDIPGPTAGLVAYWSMDSIEGGMLLDAVGGHHGQCARCPLPYAGYVGAGALRFTGDDAIVVPQSTAFELETGTISAWVFLEAWPDGTILSLPLGTSDADSYLLGVLATGALILEYPAGYNATPASAVPVMQWSHLAASWGPGGSALYVDGTRVEVAPESRVFQSGNLYIGADRDALGPAYFWTGAIDDLRLYDRELALYEIGQIGQL